MFIPLPLAAAIGLTAGEEIQWSLSDRNTLAVQRLGPDPAESADRKGAAKVRKTTAT